MPSVNQIELYPYFNQAAQLEYDKAHGIVTESWSPLGRANDILSNVVVAEIAKEHQKTISQVILRWHTQLGALPIPKASSREHQLENLAIFDFTLTEAEMAAINALDRPDGRTYGQDPDVYEEF